jgi:hypothetical protein
MGAHIIDGKFQSNKYPWCDPDFVPLKVTDLMAQPVLWAYAESRRAIDREFADDLQIRLRSAGYAPSGQLHVWTADKEEWVIAASAEDACRVYCEHIGHPLSEIDPASSDDVDWGTHPAHWSQLPDDEVLKFAEECPEAHKKGVACPRPCDENQIIHTRLTCAEHVAKNGRCYLGSANN